MNPLLRLAGLYVDTVLKTWFPQELLADLEAEALADKEAEEEVSEGCMCCPAPPITDDELVAVRQLIEERFGALKLSVVSEARGDSASPGKLTSADLLDAGHFLRRWVVDWKCADWQEDDINRLAQRLSAAGMELIKQGK